MKKGDVVEVIKCESFANTGTQGWFGIVRAKYFECGEWFVLVSMQGETSPRLYSDCDLVVIKEVSK